MKRGGGGGGGCPVSGPGGLISLDRWDNKLLRSLQVSATQQQYFYTCVIIKDYILELISNQVHLDNEWKKIKKHRQGVCNLIK